MRLLTGFLVLVFSSQLQAACLCNCDPTSTKLCASSYDLDHPCTGLCPASMPNTPLSKTACPVTKVYNADTGLYEWIVLCTE